MMEMREKEKAVREFFEQTDVYLMYDYNLRIRKETIATFLGDRHFPEVLDMPCGTGDLTIPFLKQFDELLLMDFSENMIAKAAENVPDDQIQKVRLVHSNFYTYGFEEQKFDLVVAVGILAHIDDPMKFMMRIARLVKPGGSLIVQNTNARAPFTYLIRTHQWLKRLVGKSKYKLNWLSEQKVLKAFRNEGFALQQSFRYQQSWLGFSHFFSNEAKYDKTKKIFGTASTPRNQASGSDVLYLLKKTSN